MATPHLRRLATLLAASAIVVAACGTSTTSSAPEPASEAPASQAPGSAPASAPAAGDLSVTFIPKQVNNPYFDAAATGAEKAAGELGGTFTQIGPSAATEPQVPYIQDATTQGVSAIGISVNDPDAVVPALTAARDAGIKVVGYDSSPAVGAYDVFVNQVDFSGVGVLLADWACELAPDCTGEIAVLSAAATAANQNEWIALMEQTLTEPKYAGLTLVDTVYGDDDPTTSTTQANALLANHPNLKVIVAPTTVGILAAAQVVSQAGKSDAVKVTGLGFPNDMREYVKDGTSPVFGLWSVPDLGYLTYQIAAKLVAGEITGAEGETFSVAGLNGDQPYTIGPDSVVVLGPAFRFDETNIDEFDF